MFEFDEKIICPDDPTATKERIKQYKEYYKIKYEICKRCNPKIIAEIGVRAGYSAWSFLQACPEATYIGFDANNGTHGGQGGQNKKFFRWAEKILKDYDVIIHEVDTQKTNSLPIENIDFFHVDGDHTSKGVYHDLDLAFNTITNGGFILVDDYTYLETVKIGVDDWLKKMDDIVTFEFIESLRGEILIKV